MGGYRSVQYSLKLHKAPRGSTGFVRRRPRGCLQNSPSIPEKGRSTKGKTLKIANFRPLAAPQRMLPRGPDLTTGSIPRRADGWSQF